MTYGTYAIPPMWQPQRLEMLFRKAVSQMFLTRGLFHKGTHSWHDKWV